MTQQTTKSLEFSFNWNNKLNCRAFTTIRISDRFNVGDRVGVYLKHRHMGTAEINAKIPITFGGISDQVALLDTGYHRDKCQQILQKMYKESVVFTHNSRLFLYVLNYIELEPVGDQPTLFG